MAVEAFEPGGSPLYARLAREVADDPVVAEIAGSYKPLWNAPLLVFAAVHLLELRGQEPDPWSRLPDVLRERKEFITRFVTEQGIQTNEVQRSWALLPAFLSLAGDRPLDLVELGPSAGLNLVWDRYRYCYPAGEWGDPGAGLVLEGEAVGGPPTELLARRPVVRGRLGIDRAPVDVTDDDAALILQAFVWPDQEARLERLRAAIEVARRDPPEIIRADYADELPRVLAARPDDGLTVVFHSVSTAYLHREDRARLYGEIEAAGAEGPLAWISYEFVDEEEADPTFEGSAIDLRVWPGGERTRLARADGHGNRIRWVA